MFPRQLDDSRAFLIAQAMVEGFNRHYRLFRAVSAAARARFENADWHGQHAAQADRIAFYDQRVREAVERLRLEFAAQTLSTDVWQQVKLHYIGLLIYHHQPELAETFFNSVTTHILHRSYFHNNFIFVRPAVSTDYLEDDTPGATPVYRTYYPKPGALASTIETLVRDMGLALPFAHLAQDSAQVAARMTAELGDARLRQNFQLQVLAAPFFRNKAAYVVGKLVNGQAATGFALPLLHGPTRQLEIDTVLLGDDDLQMLFSFARAYFMVEMEIPAAYVQFLATLMPGKPRWEIYTALGLQKQGKNVFYRDYLHHLRYSFDRFRIAPGIKGMVMLVFDLPSFPFVFKVIKDFYPSQKDTTRERIKAKYLLVKQHDRVGRMADTLEYTSVAFPRERFEPELLDELRHFCPSVLEEDGDTVVIQHLYIERRMVPLNIFLQSAAPEQVAAAVVEYGNAIKDMVAANIFPGDMLWKNFGVTRQGKVVFYDYDEIEYITDCTFRRVPEPRNEEEEMSGEVWYAVGPHDVFPETFGPFLLGDATVREVFMRHHADLLGASYWQAHKERIAAGHVHDVFPYDQARRFGAAPTPPAATARTAPTANGVSG